MRELDVLLSAYLDERYAGSATADKRAFRQLLELSDPELNAYLLGGQEPPSEEIAHAIQLVRSQT